MVPACQVLAVEAARAVPREPGRGPGAAGFFAKVA
jgi:hypothetical protein